MKANALRISASVLSSLTLAFTVALPPISPSAKAVATTTITEFSLPGGAYPSGITNGFDGNVWVADESETGSIFRISPAGQTTRYNIPADYTPIPGTLNGPTYVSVQSNGAVWFSGGGFQIGRIPAIGSISLFNVPSRNHTGALTAGPDGNMWFTENSEDNGNGYKFGKITPTGEITEYKVPYINGEAPWLSSITAGSDGNLWATMSTSGGCNAAIVRVNPSGQTTSFPIPDDQCSMPSAITLGSDNNVWFASKWFVGKVTPSGQITTYPRANNGYAPDAGSLTKGTDGNLWIVNPLQYGTPQLQRIQVNGTVTSYEVTNSSGQFYGITAGPDGNLWVTESRTGKVGRIPYPRGSISETMPNLKQSAEPWQSQEYDTAHSWSSKTTIKAWGCAMTSGAMVLRYYGYNKLPDGSELDPGTLNSWLKAQADGYDRAGNINWNALARLSKQARAINGITAFDALEYKRVNGADKTLLTADLEAGRPVILEEPGHFITATGVQGDTFTINDPARNITLLNDPKYHNDFLSMRRFVPHFTDLSRIEFVAAAGVTINLKDAAGQAVGEGYSEGGLLDQEGGILHSPVTQHIAIEQPSTGRYQLDLTGGVNSADIDVYMYDVEGNVTARTAKATADAGLAVIFNRENASESVIQTTTDNVAPTAQITTAVAIPATGWTNKDVSVSITATDNPGGSGLDHITYQLTGATTQATTNANNPVQITIKNEGVTVVGYSATDKSGNASSTQTYEIRIDKTSPQLTLTYDRAGRRFIESASSNSGSATTVKRTAKFIEATDKAGNSLRWDISERVSSKSSIHNGGLDLTITGISLNGGKVKKVNWQYQVGWQTSPIKYLPYEAVTQSVFKDRQLQTSLSYWAWGGKGSTHISQLVGRSYRQSEKSGWVTGTLVGEGAGSIEFKYY